MKRSKYNFFRKIDETNTIIFNSYSLAIAIADQVFFKIYDNLENIDINKLSENEIKTYESMLKCKFIMGDDTDELKNLEYLRLRKIIESNKFILYIFPTLDCNFDCYYCYEKNKTGIMSNQVQDKILEMIKYHAWKKSDIEIIWHGGEPLLAINIIYDLSEKMQDICKKNNVNYSSSLKSNGYLFTDDIIKKLKDCSINSIQITLDGPPILHNKRRYLKNSDIETFDVIHENLKKLKNNNFNIFIVTNIDKEFNIDNMLDFIRILEKNNLAQNLFLGLEDDKNLNQENKAGANTNCFTCEEYAKFAFAIFKKLHELGIKNLKNSFFPSALTAHICSAVTHNAFLVDPEGYLYKCPIDVGAHDKAVGNLMDNQIANEKLFNNKVQYMTWDPFKQEKCNDCNFFPICFGGCPRIGIQEKETRCGIWKYIIEDLVDAITLDKMVGK